MPEAASQDLLLRKQGKRDVGRVTLRSFDQGLVETLGATVDSSRSRYVLKLPNLDTRENYPGVVVTFANPEPVFTEEILPLIFVRREDITPAMNRWHPGTEQFRAPGDGALPIQIGTRTGFSANKSVQQAAPFDITYSINIMAKHRGGEQIAGLRNQVNRLFEHVMRTFQPYGVLILKDSLGDERTYEAFMEATSPLDEVADTTDRVVGFSVTVRVEGELDLLDPVTYKAVAGDPTTTASPI